MIHTGNDTCLLFTNREMIYIRLHSLYIFVLDTFGIKREIVKEVLSNNVCLLFTIIKYIQLYT